MPRRLPSLLFIALAIVLPGIAEAGIIRVKPGGTGSGTSWSDAYGSLAVALVSALPGDELWVAAGTWLPEVPGNGNSTFTMKSDVALYGGFAATEATRAERDPLAHETILSGGGGAYAKHIVTAVGVTAGAVLDGFTVAGGVVTNESGAGLVISNASPTIERCRFVQNAVYFNSGGAIFVNGGAPVIRGCEFTDNFVHVGKGGGIAATGASSLFIEDCRFSGNVILGGSAPGAGGGISLDTTVPSTIRRCTFEDNVARNLQPAGDSFIAYGGAIFNIADGTIIDSCVFRRNSAHAGGGVSNWGDLVTIANCLFDANVVTSYQLHGGGDGGDFGGGVACPSFFPDRTLLVNCVFARNRGGEGAGVASPWGHGIDVQNSIIWGNVATGQDVTHLKGQISGDSDFRYSCVEALFEPVQGEDPPDPANFPGCLDVDPRFVAIASGDLHLRSDAPCIDAAENALVPAYVTLDLDGRSRRFDDPLTPDTGSGAAPVVDMGPYEYGSGTTDAPDPFANASEASALRVFPNPTRGAAHLTWATSPRSAARVDVVDAGGRLVRRLDVAAGSSQIVWDGRDDHGHALGSGVYFARFLDGDRGRAASCAVHVVR